MNHPVPLMAIIISKSCVLDNPLRRMLLRDVRRSFEICFRTINLLDSKSSIGLFKLIYDEGYCILSCLLTTVHHYQGLLYIQLRIYGVTVWVFMLYLSYIKNLFFMHMCVCMFVCMYVCSWYFMYFFMILMSPYSWAVVSNEALFCCSWERGGGRVTHWFWGFGGLF